MQLYITFNAVDRSSAIQRMEKCVSDVRSWALQNKLSLNDSKTELIHFHSKYASIPPQISIKMGQSIIKPSNTARNLGVIMDSSLSLCQNVDSICRSAYIAIRKIGKIRRFLDQNSAHRLVHAFVTSRIDCCNSLLFGLPQKLTLKLQRVQNTAARLVSCVPRSSHITPILRKLHWLPISSRIMYKILLLTFKTYHGLAPSYLSELISRYTPVRTLRSASQSLLSRPTSTFYKQYGQRSFIFAATFLWNNLPIDVRNASSVNTFKKMLKTHLFKSCSE